MLSAGCIGRLFPRGILEVKTRLCAEVMVVVIGYEYVLVVEGPCRVIRCLPALGVVTSKYILIKILVPARGIGVVLHAGLLGVLLQVGDILRRVASLEYRVGSGAFLRSLPEKLPSERFGKLSGEHVSSGSSWGQGSLVVMESA